jgi:hypothetical protein
MILHIFHIFHHSSYSEEGVVENKGTKNLEDYFHGIRRMMEDMEDMEDHESRKFS